MNIWKLKERSVIKKVEEINPIANGAACITKDLKSI